MSLMTNAPYGGVVFLRGFQLLDFVGQVPVARQNFAQFDEGAHDEDVHLHCTLAVEYGRQHSYAEFGECIRVNA